MKIVYSRSTRLPNSQRDKRDIVGILCIPEKNGNLKIALKDKTQVGYEYEEELLNKKK